MVDRIDAWPWGARVALGAIALPGTIAAAVGLLWLLGTVLRPVVGPGAPLAGHDLAVTAVLWVVVPTAIAAVVVAVGHASRRDDAERTSSSPSSEGVADVVATPAPASPWQRAGEVLVGAVTVLWVVWPFTTAPGDQRWVGAYDAPYSAWLGWRVGEAVASGAVVPATVPDALWPAGIELAVTDGLAPTYVTALLNVVGLGPYAAYDMTLLVGVALSLWAGRRLGLALTDRRWVAMAGGVAYALAPAVAAPVQAHVAFVWSFAVPLLVRRAVLDARDLAGPRPWPLAGLAGLAFACSAYHLVFGVLAYALVALSWPGSSVRRRSSLRPLAMAAVLVVVALAPFLVARLSFEADERAAGGEESARVADALLLSADGLSALVPPDASLADLPAPDVSLGPDAFASLRIATPGLALLVGGGVAVVLRRRGAAALVGSAGVLWLLSLGPALRVGGRYPTDDALVGSTSWLPFRLLLEVPGLGNLRAPYRASFAICALLGAASVLALDAVAEHLAARDRSGRAQRHVWRPVAVAAVGALVLASSLAVPPTSDLGLTVAQRQALEAVADRGGPGEALVLVPFGCRLDDPRVVALQLVHGQPSLGCSTSRAATPWASGLGAWQRSAGLRSLWCGEPAVGAVLGDPTDVRPLDDAALDDLQRHLGLRFVVLEPGGVESVRCPWLAVSAELLVARGEVLSEADGWTVIDLGPMPPPRGRAVP